jgi:hypothetical protein
MSKEKKDETIQKTMNVSQPVVDRHLVNINIIQSSTQVRYINETARTLKIPHTLVLGNHEALNGIEEISINYNSSEEVYDHSSTIVNSNFSTMIAKRVLADPDPKTMAVCKKWSEWNK